MMDQVRPCSSLPEVAQMFTAFCAAVSAVLCAFLARRRVNADRRERRQVSSGAREYLVESAPAGVVRAQGESDRQP